MSAWEGEEQAKAHSWSYYQSAIEEAVEHLLQGGYRSIIAVGKSFGGGLLLAYHHPHISKKILWAPAVGVGDEATLEKFQDVVLSEVPLLLDIQLEKDFVHQDQSEICIIHGTADEVIPLENSRAAVAAAQKGRLVEVPSADHSFKTPEQEQALMEATQKFLTE